MTQTEYRCLDETSRIMIPKSFRKEMGLEPKSRLKIHLEDNKIIIEKAAATCRMCGTEENIIQGFEICRPCAEKAALLVKLLENEENDIGE